MLRGIEPSTCDAAGLVNLARYLIANLATPSACAAIAQGHDQLEATGLCLLPDFVEPVALAAMVSEARALGPTAYHAETWMRGSYSDKQPVPLPPSRNACAAVAYDLLALDSPVRRLYEWEGLVEFFRELLGVEQFYRCADPISSCLLMYYGDGDELGWHFDPNDGVVTLLLQSADKGGEFEFVPRIDRGDSARVERIMNGARDGIVTAPLAPGTLSLFRGVSALHRVTKIAGPRQRIMVAMSFHDRPGMMFTPENRRRYSGREA
jgi:alkylated DNA repair dioxygenase AlkB